MRQERFPRDVVGRKASARMTVDASMSISFPDGRVIFASAMKEAGLPLQNVKSLSDHIARRWIDTLIEDYELATDDELPIGFNIETDRPLWVHCGSCFVAIVGKLPASSEQEEGEYVWNQLGLALRAWRPNLFRLILSEIQNALELEAVAHHENWLNDELALGLGLYLLESEGAARSGMSPSDVEGAAQSLIDRFVDLIRRRLATHERIRQRSPQSLSRNVSVSGKTQSSSRLKRIPSRIDVVHTDSGLMLSRCHQKARRESSPQLRKHDECCWNRGR